MKNIFAAICLLLSITTNLKAQDHIIDSLFKVYRTRPDWLSTNCSVYIDGVFADTINCWTFDHMYLVFPKTDKYKYFDRIKLEMRCWYVPEKGWGECPMIWEIEFTKQSFEKNFGDAPYFVWKFIPNKFTSPNPNWQRFYTQEKFAWTRNELSGANENHFEKGASWLIISMYGASDAPKSRYTEVRLSESEKIFYKQCKGCPLDMNKVCSVTGKKTKLNIEKSLTNIDYLGIIKESIISNSVITTPK